MPMYVYERRKSNLTLHNKYGVSTYFIIVVARCRSSTMQFETKSVQAIVRPNVPDSFFPVAAKATVPFLSCPISRSPFPPPAPPCPTQYTDTHRVFLAFLLGSVRSTLYHIKQTRYLGYMFTYLSRQLYHGSLCCNIEADLAKRYPHFPGLPVAQLRRRTSVYSFTCSLPAVCWMLGSDSSMGGKKTM